MSQAVKKLVRVFGIMLKRDGCVYAGIVKNCSSKELLPILREFSELDVSVIYSDSSKAYDGLEDLRSQRTLTVSNIAKTNLQMLIII